MDEKIFLPKYAVYIAGPYTSPDPETNTVSAIGIGDHLASLGFVPYIPHLTHYWNNVAPRPYGFWLEYDKHWIIYCDALLRLPGESSGADGEVEYAKRYGIPVFEKVGDLVEYFREQKDEYPKTPSFPSKSKQQRQIEQMDLFGE